MNAPLSIAYNPMAEADQLHGLMAVVRKVRNAAAGRSVEDACDEMVAVLEQAIEVEADERDSVLNAGYVDYIVESTMNDLGDGWSRAVPQ